MQIKYYGHILLSSADKEPSFHYRCSVHPIPHFFWLAFRKTSPYHNTASLQSEDQSPHTVQQDSVKQDGFDTWGLALSLY